MSQLSQIALFFIHGRIVSLDSAPDPLCQIAGAAYQDASSTRRGVSPDAVSPETFNSAFRLTRKWYSFADVHYYFSPPASKPLHHRFDKSSYVYLYHDAINKRGRLEVANHAGTADQDAFTGCRSFKQSLPGQKLI